VYDDNDRLRSETLNSIDGSTLITSYDYDNNGNTIAKAVGNQQTTYTWNDENRLVGVDTGDGKAIGYTYNTNGIRVSSTVDGVTTQYLVDSNRDYAQVLEEYVDGVRSVSYVYGQDLISQERSSVTAFYLVDGLGSTTALTNENGNVTDTYSYQAFGEVDKQTGETNNSYRFAGELFDEETGEYYLRDRYYDSETGRFTRKDTYEGRQGEPLTLHKYMYAHNNPVTYTDPTGKYTLTEVMAIGAVVGALSGGSLGAYYGTQQSGKFFSEDTLKYALVGAVGGAAAGAMLGGAIYLTPAGLAPTVQTGLRQLWIKANGPHSTTAIATISGFGVGFTAGLLEPDYAVGLGTAATTAFSIANDALVRGAIWRRHAISRVVGPSFATHARSVLFRYTQATTFVTAGFFFGFTVGYLSGAGARTAYDAMYSSEND
jgi:RHS repeat-associated protein